MAHKGVQRLAVVALGAGVSYWIAVIRWSEHELVTVLTVSLLHRCRVGCHGAGNCSLL
jgi:hypothetical protein